MVLMKGFKLLGAFVSLVLLICCITTLTPHAAPLANVLINIQNSQASNTQSPFQQMIVFNPRNTVFEANESSNLGNIEFFMNGNAPTAANELYSWCESGCNSSVTNAILWIRLPTGVNTISNVIINMSFQQLSVNYDGVHTGEAPQLSCNNPSNTISGCAAGQYAEYDNGNNVFTGSEVGIPYFYTDFKGITCPGGWSCADGFTVDNGLYLDAGGGDAANILVYQGGNVTMDSFDIWNESNGCGGGADAGFESDNFNWLFTTSQDNSGSSCNTPDLYMGQYYGTPTHPFDTWGVETIELYKIITDTSGNAIGMLNYSGATKNNIVQDDSFQPEFGNDNNGETTLSVQWTRTRATPPNGVMPAFSFGKFTAGPYVQPTIAISTQGNSIIDVGQAETFTATATRGATPFTYNFLIVNSPANSIAKSVICTSAFITCTWTFKPTGSDVYNSPEKANIILTDAHPTTLNSIYSSAFTVNNALVAGAMASSNVIQGDVVVRHSNSKYTVYNASSNSNVSRGNALLNAFSSANLSSGDTIYLKPEVYNIGPFELSEGGSSGTLHNIAIYGAGTYLTVIVQNDVTTDGNAIIMVGVNSIAADLSLMPSLQTLPSISDYTTYIGMPDNGGTHIYGNSTISNIYCKGYTDCVYFASGQTMVGNVYIYNTTVNSYWDSMTAFTSNSAKGYSYYVIDSSFNSSAITAVNGGAAARDIVSNAHPGNLYVVNSTLTASNASQVDYAIYAASGNVLVYGGNLQVYGTNGATSVCSLYNASVGTFSINSTAKLVGQVCGPLSHLGATTYGSYSYLRTTILPIIPVTILSGQSITLSSNQIGGTPSYSYQWYANSAGYMNCNQTNAIPGATSATYLATPTTSNSYAYSVRDSASVPIKECSTADSIIVNLSTTTSSTTTVPQSSGGGGTGGLPPATTISTSVPTTTASTTTAPASNTTTVKNITIINASYSINSTGSESIAAPNSSITIELTSPTSATASLRVVNITSLEGGLGHPNNYTPIEVFNVTTTSQSNVTTEVSLKYSCSISPGQILPYKRLRDGSWIQIQQFTRSAQNCSISFVIPPDPIVGLFLQSEENSTTLSTLVTTSTYVTTTLLQSTGSNASGRNTVMYVEIIVAFAIIIVVAVIVARMRRKKA